MAELCVQRITILNDNFLELEDIENESEFEAL